MSTQVQWKRGTTAQNNTYTGAIGEIVVDTTLKQLRLHDGVTQGGTTIGSSAVTVTTATNIAGGTAGQVAYQTAAGLTSFYGPGTAGQLLISGGAAAPVYTNTASIYVGNALYSNTATNILGGTPGQLNYQTASGATSFVNTGSQGNILVSQPGAPVYTSTATFLVGYSSNIAGGTPGQLLYQASVGGTGFVGPGTAGQLLVSNGTSGPSYTSTGSIYVGRAAQADILTPANTSTQQVGYSTNILGGAAGSLPYQSAANTTAMLPIGTSGYILTVSGTTPAWSALSGLSAGLATTATNIAGGTAGQVPYQSAAGTTSFYGPGTAGQLLVSNGAAAPVYTNTASIYVGRAAQADILTPANTSTQQVGYAANLLGGAAGNIHYQTGPNASGFATNIAYSASGTASYTQATGQTLVVSSNGLGVTGNSYFANNVGVGGTLYLTGDLYVDGTQFIVNTQAIATGDKALILSTGSTTALLSNASGIYVGASSSTAYSSFYYDGVNGWIAGGTTGGSLMLGGATTPSNGAKLTVLGGANFTTIVTATTFVGGLTGTATQANNLNGGAAGSIPIQSANGTTSYIPIGSTPGYVLTAGTTTATWTAISGLSAGSATTATNLGNGTAGQIPYQTAPGGTSFFGPGTAGQLLVSNGAAAPVYTNTGSIYVNRATLADTATTATNAATAYSTIGIHTAGTGLTGSTFNGSANQTWTLNTATLMANAVTANNLAAGTAGQLVYQSGPGATAFMGPGSYGQFLMSTGASAPVYQSTLTQTNGNIIITSNTAATSTATGALQIVNGGLGVGGSIYATGLSIAGISTQTGFSNFVGSGSQEYTVRFKGSTTGDQWAIGTSGTAGFGIANDVLNAAGSAYSTFTVSASVINLKTGNSSPQTALLINQTGQVGVGTNYAGTGGALFAVNGGGYFNGIVTATNVISNGSPVLTQANFSSFGVSAITAGTDTAVTTSTGAVTIWDKSTFQTVTDRGATTNNAVTINNGLTIGSSNAYAINLTGSYSNALGMAINATGISAPTSTTGYWIDSQFTLQPTTSTFGTYYGILFLPTLGNTSTYQNIYGSFARLDMNANATGTSYVNTWVGYMTAASSKAVGATTTLTNYYGFVAQDPSGMTLTNAYGVQSQINTTAGQNKWNLYASGTAPNYLAGSLGVGTTTFTSGSVLSVQGGTYVAGTITATNMILNGYQVSTSSALTIQGYGSVLGTAGTINFSTGTTATVVNGVATIQAVGSVSGISAGTDTVVTSVAGAVVIWNTSTLQSITGRGATSTNAISITNTTAASSTLTGALLVTGGFGLGGDFYSAGKHIIQNSTQATSTTTGALQIVNGGMGVGGNAYIGGNLYTNGAQVLPTSIQEFTATGGQTTFTVAGGYTVGTIQVFANGVALGSTDFTASNSTTVVLNTARNAGDIIRTISGLTSSSINNITARTLAYAVVFG